MKKGGYRVESDSIGKKKISQDSLYGIQTLRAKDNFQVSGSRIPLVLHESLIEIKMAAAKANMECGVLDKKVGNAIIKAGKKILNDPKKYAGQFIIDVYQGGAGTPWHMNANEVIANTALEILKLKKGRYDVIDPHNHVNKGQSTNDIMPTAMRIASIKSTTKLISSLELLISALKKKGKEFHSLVKSARTHLQDAVPTTLGLEFNAWASDLEKRLKTIRFATNNLYSLQIGGTAVGTGVNAHPQFANKAIRNLIAITRLKLKPARNKIEETQFMSDFLDLSSSLRTLASDLNKIANDLRLLSSGPMTGIHEISLPKVGLGSSIMPNKYNPSMAEMLNMVTFQIMGNDEAIEHAVEAGQLDLNVMTPVIAHNLLESLEILTNAIKAFTEKCVKGIKANKEQMKKYFESSASLGTVLTPLLGYDKTAMLMKEAQAKGKSIKEILTEKKILSKEQIEKVFNKKNFGIK